MWNAIQGAAGNLANRASRLAVEVLDAGPPEQLVESCRIRPLPTSLSSAAKPWPCVDRTDDDDIFRPPSE